MPLLNTWYVGWMAFSAPCYSKIYGSMWWFHESEFVVASDRNTISVWIKQYRECNGSYKWKSQQQIASGMAGLRDSVLLGLGFALSLFGSAFFIIGFIPSKPSSMWYLPEALGWHYPTAVEWEFIINTRSNWTSQVDSICPAWATCSLLELRGWRERSASSGTRVES